MCGATVAAPGPESRTGVSQAAITRAVSCQDKRGSGAGCGRTGGQVGRWDGCTHIKEGVGKDNKRCSSNRVRSPTI